MASDECAVLKGKIILADQAVAYLTNDAVQEMNPNWRELMDEASAKQDVARQELHYHKEHCLFCNQEQEAH